MGDIGLIGGLFIALLPSVVFGLYYFVGHSQQIYFVAFIANYIVMGITRYIPSIPGGVIMDALLIFILVSLLMKSTFQEVHWERAKNGLTFSALIWLLYCMMELLNTEVANRAAWISSIRGMCIYFLVIVMLVPVIFNRYKDLKKIVFIWSILILLAVLKSYIQKTNGFDPAEWRWLMERGGSTHLLNTGIRYFSFFTDAANYGTSMGMSLVVFSIMTFFVKGKGLKIYYLLVALASLYGMSISGTRTALGVPFVGFAVYILISKNLKAVVVILTSVILVFCFLKFTYIGQGNAEIRRMRTAFNPKNDSMNVRKENQKLIKDYMVGKPFGIGLGLSGTKAQEFTPDAYIAQIPTDSWFVVLWVETGIVGFILYMILMIYCIVYGMYIVLFKIKDDELRVYLASFIAGISGMLAASYANEIVNQFPNGIIMYTLLAFVFMGPSLDKQIANEQKN